MKRLNEKTGQPFKTGDLREDGFRFSAYIMSHINDSGYYRERWYSPETFQKQAARAKLTGKTWKLANPEKVKQNGKLYRKINSEKIKQQNSDWYKNNIEHAKQVRKAWNAKNKEKLSQANKKWALKNPAKVSAKGGKRRAAKLNRTPHWLTDDQHNKIKEFYIEARRLTKFYGIKYHVDHIVPLQGKTVSGLHVPWNLQILTASENSAKRNKF